MAKTYVPVEMDIGSNRIAIVNIRSDVVDYFGIDASTTAENEVLIRKRKIHTRRNSGKLIRIPTKLVTEKKNIRYTSFRVPGNAVIGAVSNFIAEKFTTNKPEFFITQSGTKYPVVRIYGDINPGKS
ncbi:MAG: hypothetical protein AAF915_02515 [Cyanobacteria bacterium P01_D01_bin.50]